MKNPWMYIVARIVVFAVPLTLLLVLGFNPYYSVAIATAIGLAVSILFLSRSREELSKTLYEKYNSEKPEDKAEDVD